MSDPVTIDLSVLEKVYKNLMQAHAGAQSLPPIGPIIPIQSFTYGAVAIAEGLLNDAKQSIVTASAIQPGGRQ